MLKMMNKLDISQHRSIFFDVAEHKYVDDLGNAYTSSTQLYTKYLDEFDKLGMAKACIRIGKNRNHPKHEKYKRFNNERELLAYWDKLAEVACARGNKTHDGIEDCTHKFTNYKKIEAKFTNGRIYTVDDILKNPEIGEVDLAAFEKSGIKDNYPKLYAILETLVADGYRLYAEVTAYYTLKLVCGRLDLLAVKGDSFIILDWKTNKAPITFTPGYFEKDNNGELTTSFVQTDKHFNYPIKHIPASMGHKYAMQLSLYAFLIELFGLKCELILICQLNPDAEPADSVTVYPVSYYKDEAIAIIDDNYKTMEIKTQTKIFF